MKKLRITLRNIILIKSMQKSPTLKQARNIDPDMKNRPSIALLGLCNSPWNRSQNGTTQWNTSNNSVVSNGSQFDFIKKSLFGCSFEISTPWILWNFPAQWKLWKSSARWKVDSFPARWIDLYCFYAMKFKTIMCTKSAFDNVIGRYGVCNGVIVIKPQLWLQNQRYS